MNIRIIGLFFLLFFCSTTNLVAFWDSGTVTSLGQASELETAQKELQEALDQSFFLSTGYQDVISKMTESGVMDRYSNLVATLQSGSDVDQTEMTTVVADLTSLFSSMLSAYSSVSITTNRVTTAYPKAVIANPANGVYSFYSTVVLLYVARLQYLSRQIVSTAKTGADYSDQATTLFSTFADYTTSLNSLIAQFPTAASVTTSTAQGSTSNTLANYYETLPTLAINDYYNQAAQAILPNILSVISLAKSVTSDQYNQALYAINLYNSLIATTALKVPITSYSAFSDYQSALLTTLYSVCTNAINYLSKSIDFVANTEDQNAPFFNDQVTLYTKAVSAFKNVTGFTATYSILNSGLKDAQNKLTAFNSAYTSIDTIQTLYDTVISDMQKSQTTPDLYALLVSISASWSSCATTQAQLTLIGDIASAGTIKTLENKLSKIYYIIALKYVWALFAADATAGGAALTALCTSCNSASSMNDAAFDTNIKNITACLQSLYNMCSATSNSYGSSSLSTYISSAIYFANTESSSSSSATTTDFFNLQTLQSVQKLVSLLSDFSNNFVQFNTALESVSVDALSSLKAMIAKIVDIALKIDAMYSVADNSLASYISNLSVLAMPQGLQSFEELAMTLIMYILGNKAQNMVAVNTDNAMVCYALLQAFSEYLSAADELSVATALKNIDGAAGAETTAGNLVTQAQNGTWELVNNRMQNTAWLSAIELYQIVYQAEVISNTVGFEENIAVFIETINDYISAYSTSVAASDQRPLDLFFLYYLLVSYNSLDPFATDLQNTLSSMTNLFNNSNKTGFFDQLSTMITEFQNETDPTKLATEKQNILDQITIFEEYMHAELGLIAEAKLLYTNNNVVLTPLLSETTAADGSTTLSYISGTNSLTVVVPDLDAVLAAAVKAIADASFSAAQTASDQKDFVTAAQKYTDAMTQYKTIIDATEASSDVTNQYFLSLTLAKAALTASSVIRSDISTVADIPDVALTYLLSSYSLSVPSVIASALPVNYTTSSTSSTTSSSSTTLSWTNDQVQNVLKMIALNAELTNAGYTYSELYTAGTTQRVSGLQSSDSAQCDEFEATAAAYVALMTAAMTTGTLINGNAVMMTVTAAKDVSGNITMTCTNMPIAPLQGYYVGAPVAESYYSVALLLFQPGTDTISIGNSVYVPGNDATAAQNMRLYIAATSLATVDQYAQEIDTYMNTLAGQITNATTDTLQAQLVADFTLNVTNKFDIIKGALLNTTGGIIAYYTQNNEAEYASDAQTYAMQIYSDYQTNVAQLLVGDPTTKIYTSLLNTLNLAYLAQAAFETDTAAAADLKDKSAALFKTTGDACAAYKKTVGTSDQYYYKEAAEYYVSAMTQYTSNGNTAEADIVAVLEYEALAKAGLQEVNNYYYIKNNPISYTNVVGTTTKTDFVTIVSNYSAFTNQYSLSTENAMDPNELTLYNEITDLLLDGVMLLSSAAGGPTLSTSTTTSSTDAITDDTATLDADVVAFLQKNKASLLTVTTNDASSDANSDTVYSVDVSNLSVGEQLFDLGIVGVDTFVAAANKTAVAAWLNLLYKATSYLYIDQYLGGIVGSSSTAQAGDYANKWQTFLQVVQTYGVKLQNPSSVYIG